MTAAVTTTPHYDAYYKYDRAVAETYETDREREPLWWKEDEARESWVAAGRSRLRHPMESSRTP